MRRSPIKGVVTSMNVPVPDDALRLTVSFKVYPMRYAPCAVRGWRLHPLKPGMKIAVLQDEKGD